MNTRRRKSRKKRTAPNTAGNTWQAVIEPYQAQTHEMGILEVGVEQGFIGDRPISDLFRLRVLQKKGSKKKELRTTTLKEFLPNENGIHERIDQYIGYSFIQYIVNVARENLHLAQEKNQPDSIVNALMRDAIVRYASCFEIINGRLRLDAQEVVRKDAGFPEVHQFLIAERNKYIGHQKKGFRSEAGDYFIILDGHKYLLNSVIFPAVLSEPKMIHAFEILLADISDYVEARLKDITGNLLPEIHQLVQNIMPQIT